MNKQKTVALFAGFALFGAACGGGGGSAEAFCDDIGALNDFDPMADVDLTAEDPGTAMMEAFSSLDDTLDDLVDSAPSEIRSDLETLSEGFGQLADALEEADGDIFALATNEEFAAQMEALDSPEFEEASERVEDYVSNECGIELE